MIGEDGFPCTTRQARRHLEGILADLGRPHQFDIIVAKWGPNGRGPAIEALCRDAAFHRGDALASHGARRAAA